MDYNKLENKFKKIVELRSKRENLQREINILVDETIKDIKSMNKTMITVNSYSAQIIKKKKCRFDLKYLEELHLKGLIPDSKIEKIDYERLYVTSGKEIKLVGNKFVME